MHVSTCQNHQQLPAPAVDVGLHIKRQQQHARCAVSVSWLPAAVLKTGAGKTWSMSGDARNYSHRGIIPRALQHVFRDVDMRSDRIYNISVSYLEIYNETLRDLLADDPAAASDSLAILDDSANTVVGGDGFMHLASPHSKGLPLVAEVVLRFHSLCSDRRCVLSPATCTCGSCRPSLQVC